MFSPDIVQSDAFLDMPVSSQALYFHLGMFADDDGFVNPKRIMRMVGVGEDDLKVLIGKRFVLPFENGVVVIKHWKINNLVRKDWYKETQYIELKERLTVKPNGAYTELVNEMLTVRQHRLGKVRLGNISETSVSGSIPLVDNKENMGWKNKQSDNDDDMPAIDIDSREEIEPEELKEERELKELNKKIRANLKVIEPLRGMSWGVGKDMNFHVKIYREILGKGVSHEGIIKTFIEIVDTPHWKEKKKQGEFPGMNTVQFHLRNKTI